MGVSPYVFFPTTNTGGVQEDLRLEVVHPIDFFKRMEKAMEAGAIVACSVPVSSTK